MSLNSPRLPVELCEMVMGELSMFRSDDRKALVACSLVCRSWLPKARFHLRVHDIALRGRPDVDNVVRLLSSLPAVCCKVKELTIDATLDTDQSWVSSALVRLGPKLKDLHRLKMLNIDLDQRHPTFYQACSLFVHISLSVMVQQLRYSRTSHLSRFVMHMSEAQYVYVVSDSDYGADVRSDCSTVRRRIAHPTRHTFPVVSVHLALSWSKTYLAIRDWFLLKPFSGPSLKLTISPPNLWDDYQSQHLAFVDPTLWRDLAETFRRICDVRGPNLSSRLEICIVDVEKGEEMVAIRFVYHCK